MALVEMLIKEDIKAEEMLDYHNKLMSVYNEENELVNLSVNPNHYIWQPLENNCIEVMESVGGYPIPTHFYIHLGEEKGIRISIDYSYLYQSFGIAQLSDNTIIGGFRHQFKNEQKGFRAKLAVEFPSLTPNYFIQKHQLHLACN